MTDWIEKHRCTYEIQPILEIDEGQNDRVGFELNLNAEERLQERGVKKA